MKTKKLKHFIGNKTWLFGTKDSPFYLENTNLPDTIIHIDDNVGGIDYETHFRIDGTDKTYIMNTKDVLFNYQGLKDEYEANCEAPFKSFNYYKMEQIAAFLVARITTDSSVCDEDLECLDDDGYEMYFDWWLKS
jgi:hypothetical protein